MPTLEPNISTDSMLHSLPRCSHLVGKSIGQPLSGFKASFQVVIRLHPPSKSLKTPFSKPTQRIRVKTNHVIRFQNFDHETIATKVKLADTAAMAGPIRPGLSLKANVKIGENQDIAIGTWKPFLYSVYPTHLPLPLKSHSFLKWKVIRASTLFQAKKSEQYYLMK